MSGTECPVFEGVLKEIIFNWMEDNKVAKLTASFDGGGDSGSFDSYVDIELVNGAYSKEALEAVYLNISSYKINPPPPGMHINDPSMQDFVVHTSEQVEQQTSHGVDWWNDDGGNGQVEWILDGEGADGQCYKRGICLTVNYRMTTYDTSYFAVRGVVEDGEEPEA